MDSYYGTLQWYQSGRSSAAQQKSEEEIEIETEYYHPRSYSQSGKNSENCGTYSKKFSNWNRNPKAEDETSSCSSKDVHESIDRKMNEIRRMFAEISSKQRNQIDYPPENISNLPIDVVDERSSSRNVISAVDSSGRASHENQVSFEFDNFKLHKYKVYSSDELNERRDRGLCLLCDELWYLGHDCCKKKKFYVFDIDVDDALEVSKSDPVESHIDDKFFKEKISHCSEKLVEDCVQNDSIVLAKFVSENEGLNWEENIVKGKDYMIKNLDLQVFDELPPKVAENCRNFIKCFGEMKMNILDATGEGVVLSTTSKTLWLIDSGCGKSVAKVIVNQPPKGTGLLCILVSMLESIKQSWVELLELPLPPPEPPPRMN